MKIDDQLKLLNNAIKESNKVLINAEKTLDTLMERMLQSATEDQIKSIQEQTKQVKTLLNKAKKGENVDNEINNMTKIIKDGSRDINKAI